MMRLVYSLVVGCGDNRLGCGVYELRLLWVW